MREFRLKRLTRMDRRRDIDIIKGFAIILMVYGHTFCVARDFIYLFHMPVFIFISGYCFNKAHASDLRSCEGYFFSRVRRLLLPYMGFNIAYALFHNLFLTWNFYTDKPEFKLAVTPIQLAAQTLYQHRSLKDLVLGAYQVLTLEDIPQMGSATWFLIVLFLVCVVHCFVAYGIGCISKPLVRKVLWGFLFVIVNGCAWAVSTGLGADADIADRHLQFFSVYSCYLLGCFVRYLADTEFMSAHIPVPSKQEQFLEQQTANLGLLERFIGCKATIIAGPIAFGILLALGRFGTLELSKSFIINPGFLVVVTIMGVVLLASLAQDLEHSFLGSWLVIIGSHTMSILFLHILAFKLVSLLYCQINGIPLHMVASWPVIFDVSEAVKIEYTLVGIAVPLGVVTIWEKIKALFR